MADKKWWRAAPRVPQAPMQQAAQMTFPPQAQGAQGFAGMPGAAAQQFGGLPPGAQKVILCIQNEHGAVVPMPLDPVTGAIMITSVAGSGLYPPVTAPVADGTYKMGAPLTKAGAHGRITVKNGVIVAIHEAS